MNPNKIYSLLGLATKAGKVVSGEFATEKSVKSGTAYLVLVSEEASENTKKLFYDKCKFYEVPVYSFGTKDMLGHAIGKAMRSSLAVTDEGFAKAIVKLMEQDKS